MMVIGSLFWRLGLPNPLNVGGPGGVKIKTLPRIGLEASSAFGASLAMPQV